MLDLYEFCTDEHKKALEGPRKAWQEAEDTRAGLEKAAKAAAKSAAKDDKAQVAHCCCPACPLSVPLCKAPNLGFSQHLGITS